MAEEFLHRWNRANDLVLEAMGACAEGEKAALHKLWGVLGNPDLVVSHNFGSVAK